MCFDRGTQEEAALEAATGEKKTAWAASSQDKKNVYRRPFKDERAAI